MSVGPFVIPFVLIIVYCMPMVFVNGNEQVKRFLKADYCPYKGIIENY